MSKFKSILSGRPRKLNGFALGPIAVVREDAADHTVEHERVHIRQFWRTLGFSTFKRILKTSRVEYELEAYVASVRAGRPLSSAARALAIHTGSVQDATRRLEDALKE
jgi:hypothetical protein